MRTVLATICNPGYIKAVRQLFASAKLYGNWTGDFMVLATDFNSEDYDWFHRNDIVVIENVLPDIDVSEHDRILFSKINLFNKSIKKWDIVLYLDADMMIFRPLDSIINFLSSESFMAQFSIAGVRGLLYPGLHERIATPGLYNVNDETNRLFQEIKVEHLLDGIGFNGGMYAFATKHLPDDFLPKLEKVLEKYYPIFPFHDECILPIAFPPERRFSLPYDCNTLIPQTPVPLHKRHHFRVLHFCSRNKPWLPENEYHDLWQMNLKQSDNLKRLRTESVCEIGIRDKIITHIALSRFYLKYWPKRLLLKLFFKSTFYSKKLVKRMLLLGPR